MLERDARRHADVWALLPMIVIGRATPDEQARAETHLRDCADCRDELAREEALARLFAKPSADLPDADPGLDRLMRRLDRDDDEALSRSDGGSRPARVPRMWWGAAAAVGVLEIVLLGVLAAGWQREADAPYRTLTRAEAREEVGVRWRVVFDERLSLQELQALLLAHGLSVESGPSEAGVFTLGARIPPADPEATAATLRRLPQVRFAEVAAPAR